NRCDNRTLKDRVRCDNLTLKDAGAACSRHEVRWRCTSRTSSALLHSLRFCVVFKKENYLDQQPAKTGLGSAKQISRQPGNTIYLLPTLVLANLMPCDLNYYIKGTSIKGSLKTGKEAMLHAADTSQNMELVVLPENFPVCKELLIPPGTQNYVVRM
uniref:Vacuolar protein sorting-associated protein 13 VPS13 adaptor binding domain-containing protein n=1 Tax=Hucho hucho TaxID=62062 RepID=A0A4W5MRR0_9TELE